MHNSGKIVAVSARSGQGPWDVHHALSMKLLKQWCVRLLNRIQESKAGIPSLVKHRGINASHVKMLKVRPRDHEQNVAEGLSHSHSSWLLAPRYV